MDQETLQTMRRLAKEADIPFQNNDELSSSSNSSSKSSDSDQDRAYETALNREENERLSASGIEESQTGSVISSDESEQSEEEDNGSKLNRSQSSVKSRKSILNRRPTVFTDSILSTSKLSSKTRKDFKRVQQL